MIDNTLQRIISLMKEQRIQDQEMIEYLGLPRGAFSNWRREKGKSYYEHIDKIADRLNVTIDYLIRGTNLDAQQMTTEEVKMFELFRKLTPERKAFISQAIKMVTE